MKKISHSRTVAFGECDPQSTVSYPNIFQWFNRNCERLFRDAGLKFGEMFNNYHIEGIPLVEATSKFLNPIHQDDEVEIESWIEEWGNTTFTVHHQISKAGELLAEGREVRAWVIRDDSSPRGIRATPVPEDVKAHFLH